MRKHVYLILLTLFFASHPAAAQTTDSLADNIADLTGNFLAKIQRKYSSIEKILSKKIVRYLHKMERQEKKLQHNVLQADSSYMPYENIDPF